MGVRFRKSFKLGPIRTTISKSGISTSIGMKGARITNKANGNTMTTLSIPGSGISYVTETKSSSHNSSSLLSKYTTSTSTDKICSYQEYIEVPDSRTLSAPTKRPWKKKFKRALCYIGILTGVLFISALIDFPPAILGAVLGLIIFSHRKNKKWKQKFVPLREPVSYDEYSGGIDFSTALTSIRQQLRTDLFFCYCHILQYCDLQDTVFTPFDVNASENTTFSRETFNLLHDYGYLKKPSQGHYCLNMDKVILIQEAYKKLEAQRQAQYDEVMEACRKYNEQAWNHNTVLIQSRLEDLK